MKYQIKKNITDRDLKNYGFRYKSESQGDYVYYLPVYKYNGKTVIYVDFVINIEENAFIYTVKSSNDSSLYHPYYDKDSNNQVRDTIEVKVQKEIKRMIKEGIINEN